MKSFRFLAVLVLAGATASAASAQPGVRAIRNLEYARVEGNRPLCLDLYLPERAEGPLPLLVWIHGGGWVGGNKNACPPLVMVPKGFAAASIQYRLADVAPFPAQIHDCKGAIRFLRANASKYNLDPNRIGVWGASAGGHLAALLGAGAAVNELDGNVGGNLEYSSRVQAVCDFFGPSNLMPLTVPGVAPNAAGPVTKLLGGPASQKKELAALASPVTHVTKDAPPFLILHGDRDNVVPLQQSQELHDLLKKAGVDSTLGIIRGAGHGFAGPQINAAVEAFFAKHLAAPAATSKPAPTSRPAGAPASRPGAS